MSSDRTLSLFVVASLFLGTSFVAIKVGVAEIPPVLFAALRFDIGGLLLLGFVAAVYDDWVPRTRSDALAILSSGVFVVAVNNALLFVGQQGTTSGAAAVMYSLLPLLSPLFALALLRDERISWIGAVGILLGLVGVLVIVQPTSAMLRSGAEGQALVAVAAVSIALGSVLIRRVKPRLATLPLSAWAFLFGALCIHAGSLALGESVAIAWTPKLLAAVAYVGVLGTGVAYAAYFLLIERAGPIRANLTAYAVPAVATLTGWLVLDETVGETTGLGFAVILLGFGVLQREQVADALSRFDVRFGGRGVYEAYESLDGYDASPVDHGGSDD
ncbi:DMT family transporter [Haloprofundus salinisoli]|uniref:DMT family transporter n=1 Tax=Haloprofundus salinisoli TaxID=2876193 RepID=UPI001CCB1300|nr:EamA family transporter [Haloprofundus salinisoli]